MAQVLETPEQASVADGATVSFPISFTFTAEAEIEVVTVDPDTGARTVQVLDVDYAIPAGDWATSGGSAVFLTGHEPVANAVVERRRITPPTQPVPFGDDATFRPVANEQAFDKLTRQTQELRAARDRAVAAPVGEAGFTLPHAALRQVGLAQWTDGKLEAVALQPGEFLVADADGRLTHSAGTGGGDAALRVDLAGVSGAALIGAAGGGSLQGALNAMLAQQGAYARDYPPYGGGTYYGDVWPNAVNLVAAVRMSATLILVRCWKDTVVDEFVLRDPAGYQGVDAGWQLVSHRCFYRGQVFDWFRNPDEDGAMTNVDFAIRIGPYDQTYHSSGDGPTYAYTGFGHGRAVSSGTPQIILDGAGANLQTVEAWPVGTRKNGDALSVSCGFTLKFWNDGVSAWSGASAVDLTRVLIFGTAGAVNQVLSDTISFSALIANVGIQDAYGPMPAASFGGYADTAKLDGYPAVPMIGDDTQKGNWHGPASGTLLQFYNAANPTIAQVTQIVYGPPIRIDGVDQAWTKNRLGRIHVTDGKDFSKFRVFIASSEAELPRTAWELPMGETWSMLTRRRTDILPGGPA